MRLLNRWLAALALAVPAGTATVGAALAEADADVGIDVTVTVVFNRQGEVAALRQRWTFDYDYSAMAKVLIDANRDGSLDGAELAAAVAPEGVLGWMARTGYYTEISEGGQGLRLAPAEDVLASYDSARLAVEFTLPLASPPQLAIQTVTVTDPSFFYVLRYAVPGLETDAAPDFCTVVRRSVIGSTIEFDVRCR